MTVRLSPEYAAIQEHYGTRRAERSQVMLMEHINQGLRILQAIGADYATQCAYCLHPLFQNDAELLSTGVGYAHYSKNPYSIMLVMEYRQQANAWLSDKVRSSAGAIYHDGEPHPGPLFEVKNMLIADKVQNYKDFLLHHFTTHERAQELDFYFMRWLKVLGITPIRFQDLCVIAQG